MNYCRKRGYKSIYLVTTSDLKTAINIYEKIGFTLKEETENHTWADHLKELIYELKL